jgi:hypothetical protein
MVISAQHLYIVPSSSHEPAKEDFLAAQIYRKRVSENFGQREHGLYQNCIVGFSFQEQANGERRILKVKEEAPQPQKVVASANTLRPWRHFPQSTLNTSQCLSILR